MPTAISRRRPLTWVAVGCALTLLLLALLRLPLAGLAVNALLHLGGASEIKFTVAEASPWRVVVEDIAFQVRTQLFGARRVTVERAHWWTPSLGVVAVEQARVPYTIDGSDLNPSAWATYKNGKATVEPLAIPAEEISVDGQLIVQAAGLPEQALTVKLAARMTHLGTWDARVNADAPGLAFQGTGTFHQATNELAFKVPSASLDLKVWSAFVQRLMVLPGGKWDLAGQLSGAAEGRLVGKKLAATASVHLRHGEVNYPAHDIVASGIEADLEVADLDKFVTQPGTLRVHEVRTGRLVLRDLQAVFAFADAGRIRIDQASFQALGGKVSTEPFRYFLDRRELEAVVMVEGIRIEEVMALTENLPAQATGRVNGRLPLRIDDSGLRLGTGWLALMPGVRAEIQFNAGGLLTGGVSPRHPSYAVLKKVESGLLKLNVGEMRLDIRPPDAPAGRSSQLHLQGQPVDPEVKAPVILDLNVNGPLERLLNLGLDSRVSIGSKP